ncbi:hypothetical protein [Flavobacterium piscis]|uniref:Toxin-antitoxin system YwqK family antitoxin n=1 Tax=Flavobacterium piscis TaxID=1114874 RepID=A0ABU1Y9R3_9FLAO|nr:hypothetical protein [Flavobacterium piscis]MDR7210980.1 hypothetical protein [Flavobacterium piscis]
MSTITIVSVFIITCCSLINRTRTNGDAINENVIISKIDYKNTQSKTDTLWVSQNDTAFFRKIETMIHRPCSKPKAAVLYELINPKDGVYYLIYNDKKQLITEGMYTAKYTYEGITYERGNFYNSKNYNYKKNGVLETTHYQEDGRNSKTEHFDSKKQLTKIRYIDKKSATTTKIEIYKKGQLKETQMYTSLSTYYTVKAN